MIEFRVSQVQRIDKLISNFLNISRSLAQDYILNNLVKVNNSLVNKTSKILKPGDLVTIKLQYERKNNNYVDPKRIELYKDINFRIIYEDENILCINKPPISVNKVGNNLSVVEYFTLENKNPYIVHRLDKQTTGCLVLAKNYQTAFKISELFKNRKVQKGYFAIVQGKLDKDLIIEAPIYHTKNPLKKEIVSYGKYSKTIVKVKKHFDYNFFMDYLAKFFKQITFKQQEKYFSLLDIQILTGRTHQIRVHLSYLGYPIVGDLKYGSNVLIENNLFLLHSHLISFSLEGKNYVFKCFPDWYIQDLA